MAYLGTPSFTLTSESQNLSSCIANATHRHVMPTAPKTRA
ncbi:unnamed protein product [Chondrus crispus]|uniref:Uncharacterized protein n=1 Tax=Chondrus crispus TaxID=2769 RepID=R7Q4N2_CHOCR|nr:unnamed protein product [Chondrus crispus]CDF32331.1 unnamed protein product [Chondrus crispus]|eukprot:XP_005711996.1 unnamed protein product [Chondrus crispus]